ncbi:NADH-quinone oxidoreductase subunit F [Acidaminobacter sp. JC074]|uniref:complex I 51 kDa subunit family protein n=1 Tax=Acidaminobacter sp. JC074 TaxID=2530199 RepID=UPI001F1173D6|nr:NADH-ubiquinone oxidoreductase-F iron-sulfur binding region domain-containing protein [Acidaminobacter sp. JC074]MCH4890056.1 NADH-quinone oxidoreductase subunit F [Acidaminobacter sp. JC074]
MRPLITEYFGKYKCNDVQSYVDLGGYSGLKKVIQKGVDWALEELKAADIRGRGGAEYPAWRKWSMAKGRQGEKLILCNADEGEPGSFKDRDILLHDPMKIIEGMTIAAYCTGAKNGYIYIREEYAHIRERFIDACESAKSQGYLGNQILGQDFDFDIHVNIGAGAYICGENTALIESMHGMAGRPRLKPPRVGEKGLFGLPTLVNNVETFVCATTVFIHGKGVYCQSGTEKSKGNKVISLSGKIKHAGTYEIPFGMTINEILNDLGGGSKNGLKLSFVQSGGASGPLIPASEFDMPFTYEDFKDRGFVIGAGSMVVVDESMDLIDYLIAVEGFFHHESCGKCTPCREGMVHIVKILDKINNQTATLKDLDKLKRVMKVMVEASFCGLGTTAPTALYSAFKYFEEDLCKNIIGWEAKNDSSNH